MNVVTAVAFAGLSIAAALCAVRLLRPGSLADRVVALDTLVIVAVSGIAVGAARASGSAFLDLLLVVSLVGFVGTATMSRFIERRGAR